MKKAILVAGGTGGHINAAIALGDELKSQNYEIIYFTGQRHLDYKLFKNQDAIHLNVLGVRYKNPFKIIKSIFLNIISGFKVITRIYKEKPDFLLGTGGYVCGSVLLAGYLLKKPIYILEQNSVFGLTNKILAKLASKVFIHFKDTKNISTMSNLSVVGNPTRNLNLTYENKFNEGQLKVLVFGGSLGAIEINNIIKELCNEKFEFKLDIIHQVGKNKCEIKNINESIKYTQFEYLDEIDKNYEWSDIIVSRAGASTVSELRFVQKPCYLIPYLYATDNHQETNAKSLQNEKLFKIEIYDRKITAEENYKHLISFIKTCYQSANDLKLTKIENDTCFNVIKEIEENVGR
jgi:UDP-N-acetylglucosamine--N-acetylmuramyl-(pentapeptide) pyrophosphoryl-undecaprenol N-acetylglucosamine transferase